MAKRKLVKDMTEEERTAFQTDLAAKKEKIRSMSPDERAEYEKRRQRKWSDDYMKRAYDMVNFRVPKGGREVIKDAASEAGMTMSDFLRKLVAERMIELNYKFDPSLIFPEGVKPDPQTLNLSEEQIQRYFKDE